MARVKLIVRKHVHEPRRRNVVTTESHSDGQNAGYFLSTLRTVLLALGYSEPPIFSMFQGCFVGTHTFGVCPWSSMRGQQPIIFAASVTWSRLPHQGRRSREAWERLHEKLWCCYDMKRRNKWSSCSTTTSQAMPKKELKLSWCPQEILTTSGASSIKWSWHEFWFEIKMRPSRRSTC
jgi:hypothetical protein